MARTLTCMATKTKAKIKVCVHCGHTFDPNGRWHDLSNPEWLPAASVYCSQYCCDRYHLEMVHCCSTHVKEKARREAARAAR
jgi:NMD protein affecting ribosome stability and mRNA decay